MRLLIATILLLAGCAHWDAKSAVVLDYRDFGPQAAAYELLGMQWWQWQPHGESRPVEYDIKVVVYKDIPLTDVKQKYPVVEKQLTDYRYVSYHNAVRYLDAIIQENLLPDLTARLIQTKATLTEAFGR